MMQPKKNNFEHKINAEQLKNKLDNHPDMILINVLNQQAYTDCHITGSINIPLDQLLETVASWDKDKEIIVYCAQSSCNASDQAYNLLAEMGFVHIFKYPGGMKDWFAKHYECTGTCTMQYLHD